MDINKVVTIMNDIYILTKRRSISKGHQGQKRFKGQCSEVKQKVKYRNARYTNCNSGHQLEFVYNTLLIYSFYKLANWFLNKEIKKQKG